MDMIDILDAIDLERNGAGKLQVRKGRKAFCRYIYAAGIYQAFALDVIQHGEHQFLIESHDLNEIDAFLSRLGFERI